MPLEVPSPVVWAVGFGLHAMEAIDALGVLGSNPGNTQEPHVGALTFLDFTQVKVHKDVTYAVECQECESIKRAKGGT